MNVCVYFQLIFVVRVRSCCGRAYYYDLRGRGAICGGEACYEVDSGFCLLMFWDDEWVGN